MLLVLSVITALVDPMAACTAAVHGNLSAAAKACAAPAGEERLWEGGGPSGECRAAMLAGQQAGKYGPGLPEVARLGLVKDFEKKAAACRSAKPKPAVACQPSTRLWGDTCETPGKP